MLVGVAELKADDDSMEVGSGDLAVLSHVKADVRSTATPTILSHCDAKSIAARRRRREIRHLRMMTSSGKYSEIPAKRQKANGNAVSEDKMDVCPPTAEDMTARTGNSTERGLSHHPGTVTPLCLEEIFHRDLCHVSSVSEEMAVSSDVNAKSGFDRMHFSEAAVNNCHNTSECPDGISRINGGGLVERVAKDTWEDREMTSPGSGWTEAGGERQVGYTEWWRESKVRPPLELGCPDYGAVSVCGRRREMEDVAVVVPAFLSLPSSAAGIGRGNDTGREGAESFHFFGVFDGHGGAQVAEHCKERLHRTLMEEIRSAMAAMEGKGSRPEAQWEAAMVASFRRVDAELGGNCTREPPCRKGNGQTRCCMGPVTPGTVGSTAVVAVLGGGCLVVGNCGDSRAVLCRGGRAIPLSREHKPSLPDEMARIEAAGGRVIAWNGYRVLGVLAMSRAIGDRYLKPYVIPVPEITYTLRNDDDECLILASDGLWDVLSNDEVCDVTRRYLACSRSNRHSNLVESEESPAEGAAALLTKLALAKNSRDNISVVVVDLKA